MNIKSVLIWIAWLVMKMSKGGEGPGSQSVELISEHLNLLGLLLGDVEELALVSDFLNLLARISISVIHSI